MNNKTLSEYNSISCILDIKGQMTCKRDIENSLFYQPKTSMLFGDAKKVLQDLCAEVKAT